MPARCGRPHAGRRPRRGTSVHRRLIWAHSRWSFPMQPGIACAAGWYPGGPRPAGSCSCTASGRPGAACSTGRAFSIARATRCSCSTWPRTARARAPRSPWASARRAARAPPSTGSPRRSPPGRSPPSASRSAVRPACSVRSRCRSTRWSWRRSTRTSTARSAIDCGCGSARWAPGSRRSSPSSSRRAGGSTRATRVRSTPFGASVRRCCSSPAPTIGARRWPTRNACSLRRPSRRNCGWYLARATSTSTAPRRPRTRRACSGSCGVRWRRRGEAGLLIVCPRPATTHAIAPASRNAAMRSQS